MFPYLDIIKRAYELTRGNLWLWIWGLFLSGLTILNFAGLLLRRGAEYWPNLFTAWLSAQNQQTMLWLLPSSFSAAVILLLLFGLSKAATIWSAGELIKSPRQQTPPTLKSSFQAARHFFWPVLSLQILITVIFLLLLLIFAFPVYYLFAAGAHDRGIILLLLGVIILVPAALVFGFLHLFGPVFIVLYRRPVNQALALSFSLIRRKLRECIILSAFLIGLEILFMAAVAFSLLLLALPVGLLAWSGVDAAAAGFLIGGIYVIVLKAGFAIFQNVAWVLAMQEMVRTNKLEAPEKTLATEPEPAN